MKHLLLILLLLLACPVSLQAQESFDVVVYGGTSAGVAAAVQASRMGKSAVLIEPGKHLGGLSSGGLGMTDIGDSTTVGGIAYDFYRRVKLAYAGPGRPGSGKAARRSPSSIIWARRTPP